MSIYQRKSLIQNKWHMLILVDLLQCVLNRNKKILLSDIYNSGQSENVTSSVCLFASAGVLLLARTSCVQLLLHVNQQWRHVEKALMWPPFFVFLFFLLKSTTLRIIITTQPMFALSRRIRLRGLWQSSGSTEGCNGPEVKRGPGSDGQGKESSRCDRVCQSHKHSSKHHPKSTLCKEDWLSNSLLVTFAHQ